MKVIFLLNWLLIAVVCEDNAAADRAQNHTFGNNSSLQSEAPRLLIAHQNGVVVLNLETRQQTQVTTASASGVDYHYEKNLVFWSDNYATFKVYVQQLNSTSILNTISVLGSWQPVALAVDWVGDKLYVVDALACRILAFELDGRGHNVLLEAPLKSPQDIAVDPISRLMFIGDLKQIVRVQMDGTQPKAIISDPDYYDTFGVTVDTESKRLYFCSSSQSDAIESSDYEGRNSVTVLRLPQYSIGAVSLTTFKHEVFWSDGAGKRIGSVDENRGSPSIRYEYNLEDNNNFTAPRGLAILHSLKQTSASNPCGSDNGGCSHMCILTANDKRQFRCMCHVGYTLQEDLKTCVPPKEFLLYTRKRTIQGKILNSVQKDVNELLYIDVSDGFFVALDFNSREEHIYYSEIYDNVLYQINKNGTDKRKILDVYKEVDGLAFDWLSNNLYYTSLRNGSVNVLSTKNGAHKSSIIVGLDRPRGIVVHPKEGFIFVSAWGTSAIIRANTDGSNLFFFEGISVWPNGLSIDFEANRLYWCDGNLKHIQHSTLDGKDVKTITSTYIQRPFSIVIHKQYIYLSDWNVRGIVRMDKESGREESVVAETPGVERVYVVKYYSEDLQPVVENHPCYNNNGNCGRFCFAVRNYKDEDLVAKCGCADGEMLLEDGLNCVLKSLIPDNE